MATSSTPTARAIFTSWGLAFFEYVLQVPTNRLGSHLYTLTQLKIMQEAIALLVFSVIAYLLFGQKITLNTAISYAFILAAVWFAFSKDKGSSPAQPGKSASPDEVA